MSEKSSGQSEKSVMTQEEWDELWAGIPLDDEELWEMSPKELFHHLMMLEENRPNTVPPEKMSEKWRCLALMAVWNPTNPLALPVSDSDSKKTLPPLLFDVFFEGENPPQLWTDRAREKGVHPREYLEAWMHHCNARLDKCSALELQAEVRRWMDIAFDCMQEAEKVRSVLIKVWSEISKLQPTAKGGASGDKPA